MENVACMTDIAAVLVSLFTSLQCIIAIVQMTSLMLSQFHSHSALVYKPVNATFLYHEYVTK